MLKKDIIDRQDLAPSDYNLFGPMKKGLRDKNYASDEELKTSLMKWLEKVNRTLRGRGTCSHSIKRNGDYFEK